MTKKKKDIKTIAVNAKGGIKKGMNINRYNKYLFIIETLLLVGVADEFLENLVMKWDFGLYINVSLIMIVVAVLFALALKFIEPMTKNAIIWIVRLNNNKILRVAVHIVILSLLFYLYAQVFFSTTLSLSVNIGVNAS